MTQESGIVALGVNKSVLGKRFLLLSSRQEHVQLPTQFYRMLSELTQSSIQTFTKFCWLILFLVSRGFLPLALGFAYRTSDGDRNFVSLTDKKARILHVLH